MMSTLAKLSLIATLVIASTFGAEASDPRCSRPPYGGSADRYRATLEAHGQKTDGIAKTLEDVCNMKFGGADRGPLLKLGLTDQDIERMDTATLATEMLERRDRLR